MNVSYNLFTSICITLKPFETIATPTLVPVNNFKTYYHKNLINFLQNSESYGMPGYIKQRRLAMARKVYLQFFYKKLYNCFQSFVIPKF